MISWISGHLHRLVSPFLRIILAENQDQRHLVGLQHHIQLQYPSCNLLIQYLHPWNADLLQVRNLRSQQVIGVSSDEELTNMIKFQNAYNASSRFINVVDEMIETIINRLG